MALRSFANGVFFAETYGEGPPRVLALHGWGRRGSDFGQSLAGIPALAPDLPGFGASPAPHDAIGAEGYADIVSEILPAFDRPPVLVGHSFGGRVGTCLAARHADAFSHLVLTGAPVLRARSPGKPSLGYRVLRSLNRAGILSDERMEDIRRRSGSADYRAASGVMRDVLVKVVNETYEGQLGQLACPVVMVWGERDTEVPIGVATSAGRLIEESGGSSTLDVLEGIGHNVPLEAPDALRQVILSLTDGE